MNVMYANLGASFVEVVERRRELRGRAVGVCAAGRVTMTLRVLAGYGWMGIKGRVWEYVGGSDRGPGARRPAL